MDIGGSYPLQGWLPPEQIPTGNRTHKSGARTGTTSGDWIPSTCYTTSEADAPIIGFPLPTSRIWFKCVTLVQHMGWGTGDSGGPVFGRLPNQSTYYALGIVAAGAGARNETPGHPDFGRCIAGTGCTVLFHKWSNIQDATGLRLYPK